MPNEETTASRSRIGRAVLIAGAAAIAAATLTPLDQDVSSDVFCVICGQFGGVDVLLNVLLFVPLGVGLGLAGVRASRAIPAIAAATFLIETLQSLAISGRDASVGDVLANSLGGILGLGIGGHIDSFLRPSCRRAIGLTSSWLCLWWSVQAVASYSLLPRPTDAAPYHGHIGRAHGGDPPYPGRVLSVAIDGQVLPDSEFNDTKRARDALSRDEGANTALIVVPNGSATWLAPMLRVVDEVEREVLVVAAERSDLVFGMRTGAAVLRLRPLLFHSPGVFPTPPSAAAAPTDTIHIRTRYALPQVEMSTISTGRAREVKIDLTPGAGWRLILPTRTLMGGSSRDAMFNAGWLLVLLVPAGYWAALARKTGDGSPGAKPLMGVAFIALVVGFSIGPVFFGLASPAWTEVLGGVSGLLAGATIAHVARLPARPRI